MIENITPIKNGIAINAAVKKFTFGILLHVVGKMVNI